MNQTSTCCPFRSCSLHRQHTPSQHIPHIAAALNQANVSCVRVKYDGQFDFGRLEEPIYLQSAAAPLDRPISKDLHTELRVFFNELLELRFPAWDNAEGACGEFQWHPASDVLAQAHIARSDNDYKVSIVTGL